MIEQRVIGFYDNAGVWHEVVQVWAKIPATGVWMIVSAHEIEVAPADRPVQPTRPA